MKVILREDVEKLGKAGDVVKVADGFGRNYLIPRQLAVPANVRNLKALEHDRRVIEARAKKSRKSAESLAEKLALVPKDRWEFLWLTGFPLFEWSVSEKRWAPAQHPFTGIVEEDADKLESAPQDVRSKGYDLVLNGVELGSGSIRIHSQELQSRVFALLGLDERQRRERFGFFLDALSYGTPPHGGIALGLDRVVALLAGEKSLREVIAFPKTTTAQDLMAEAPSPVDEDQLDELGIDVPPVILRLRCTCGRRLRAIGFQRPTGFQQLPQGKNTFVCPHCGTSHEAGPALAGPFAVQYFEEALHAWLQDPSQTRLS